MRVLSFFLLILFLITGVVFGIDQYFSYRDKDGNAPIITSSEDILRLSVEATDTDLLRNIVAKDDRDGDVTSTLAIVGRSNFIEEGVIRVDYAAFDSHNNIGTYSRRVIFDNYHSPRFSSKKPLITRSETETDFSFLEASDVLDGDVSNKIKVTYDVNSSTSTSEFPFCVEVTNSYGDVEKLNLSLDVVTNKEYNRQCPALSEYIVYVPTGNEIDLSSYIVGIRQGDNVIDFEETDYNKEEIMIDNFADYERQGIYTAEFSLQVSYSTYTVTKMIVVVTEDF